ncbi:MAG: replicative DNA helicase [Kiritimatiellia bacterium]|nr:replicative DNA helicase [Kiritimatiellia bacterium]
MSIENVPAAARARNERQPLPERSERRGKPIFNEEAEMGVLGSILLDAQKVVDFCVEKQISTESFYLRHHQLIYSTMQEMNQSSRPIDVLTLSERLQAQGILEEVGGSPYINRLLDSTPTAAHAEYYVDLVRQQHLLRRIIDCARNSENECYTSLEEADAILAKVEQDFFSISEERHASMVPWSQAVKETMVTVENILNSKKSISGIPTGFRDLDEQLLGLHPQDMIIIAARPSMGKTSLAMNIAENVALGKSDNHPQAVGIFSLEMARESLILRLLGSHARIPVHDIAGGYLTDKNHRLLTSAADIFSKAPIFLDDTGGLDILELRARARRMKKKHNISLFIVDYLQLLHCRERSREGRQNEISSISGSLKNMAKELKVPVLVISQLNRAPEARDREGKPRLADLRDSGSIEQDADVVCLLMLPSKYRAETETASEEADEAIINIAKQRNGPTGEVKLTFLKQIMRFESAAPVSSGETVSDAAPENEI